MKAIRRGRPAADSAHERGRQRRNELRPCGRAGAATLLALAMVLLTLVGAAPASAAQPPGLAQQSLARLALQQAQLIAGDGDISEQFGYSVAVSGDTAVVGAASDDVGPCVNQGSAYVFTRVGLVWLFQQKLTAFDGTSNDYFGYSVAVSGDTALVGAATDQVGAHANQGSAYVFTRAGTAWTFQQQLYDVTSGAAGDLFGWSVALSGDTALVGAKGRAILFAGQGSAYVFTRSGAIWAQQAQLTAAAGADGDSLGESVALSGDTALVGAPFDDVDGIDQGSAYAFTRSGSAWTQQGAMLTAGTAGDRFGTSVAVSGDTALIGAPCTNVVTNTNQGSAYAFTRSGATWAQQMQLVVADGAAYDELGTSVAVSGETAVVGAPRDNVGANPDQGSAYVFVRSAATWAFQQQLNASAAAAADASFFGSSVALSDGRALVGAPYYDVGAFADAGSAWAYLLDAAAPVTTATLVPAANAAGWCKKTTTVSLPATDDLTGVAGTEYRRVGAASWVPYAAPFVVGTQGVTNWECRSSDVAGNLEAAQGFSVKIDKSKPTTKAYAATVVKGKKVKLAYKVSDAKPGCGRAKVTLEVYKGKKLKKTIKVPGTCGCNAKKTYGWRCTLAAGSYTIKVYARDIAGNAQRRAGSAGLTVR